MTLTTHPHSVPDALVATLPVTDEPTPSITDEVMAPAKPTIDDPSVDRLGRGCRTCAAGTYAAGPGAGHVTCDTCGHATVRRGLVGARRTR